MLVVKVLFLANFMATSLWLEATVHAIFWFTDFMLLTKWSLLVQNGWDDAWAKRLEGISNIRRQDGQVFWNDRRIYLVSQEYRHQWAEWWLALRRGMSHIKFAVSPHAHLKNSSKKWNKANEMVLYHISDFQNYIFCTTYKLKGHFLLSSYYHLKEVL